MMKCLVVIDRRDDSRKPRSICSGASAQKISVSAAFSFEPDRISNGIWTDSVLGRDINSEKLIVFLEEIRYTKRNTGRYGDGQCV